MPFTPGQNVSSYQIVRAIGKGGMGEVYRATDTRLDRDVAIKVLPDEFARDEERVSRFGLPGSSEHRGNPRLRQHRRGGERIGASSSVSLPFSQPRTRGTSA